MKTHFLGIGGIGVSALAQYYLAKGHSVTGSDLSSSEITDYLERIGVKIEIGQKNSKSKLQMSNQIQNPNYKNELDSRFSSFALGFGGTRRGNDAVLPDLVIYSPAVKQGNPVLKFYKNKGVKCLSYPEALGKLTEEYFTIAISGSHGKSTTTAMTALALIKAGLDPTVIVGTKLKEFGNTNFRAGKGKYLVIEACEHEESFLNYKPKIIVITNIEAEHLDYYKNLKNVISGFCRFVSNLPKNGVLILNGEDKNARKVKRKTTNVKCVNFSIKQKEAIKIKNLLKIPGKHNVYNALAVLAIARELGIDDRITVKSLSEYRGSWRRFETKIAELRGKPKQYPVGKTRKIIAISDYAHHPTEVLATLKAAREKFLKKKIWCLFQPHQFQRTFLLFNDFVKIFRGAKIDNVIITDIYGVAGRENAFTNVSSEKLVIAIKKKTVIYIPFANAENYIRENIRTGNVLIIMGAGDIYKLYNKL